MRRNRAPDHAAGPPARVLIALVEAYRRRLSPLTPARCRFLPTCSAYAIQAIRERGVLVGVGLSTWRVLRCHPFHPGGYDPVPRRRGDDPGASSVQCESPPSGVIR